jgi:hypothetical protein
MLYRIALETRAEQLTLALAKTIGLNVLDILLLNFDEARVVRILDTACKFHVHPQSTETFATRMTTSQIEVADTSPVLHVLAELLKQVRLRVASVLFTRCAVDIGALLLYRVVDATTNAQQTFWYFVQIKLRQRAQIIEWLFDRGAAKHITVPSMWEHLFSPNLVLDFAVADYVKLLMRRTLYTPELCRRFIDTYGQSCSDQLRAVVGMCRSALLMNRLECTARWDCVKHRAVDRTGDKLPDDVLPDDVRRVRDQFNKANQYCGTNVTTAAAAATAASAASATISAWSFGQPVYRNPLDDMPMPADMRRTRDRFNIPGVYINNAAAAAIRAAEPPMTELQQLHMAPFYRSNRP